MDNATAAANAFNSGAFRSNTQAARAHNNCPVSTVRSRLAGILPHNTTDVVTAQLTRYQEDILAGYIRDLQLQYAPVNNTQLALVAQGMARQNHPTARLGKHWIRRFITRRKELGNIRNKALTKDRIIAAIP